jgi:NADPH-dependent curcumin reductase CurA
MRDAKNYAASFKPGEPLNGGAVARVKVSKSSKYKEGDVVVGYLPWCSFQVVKDAEKVR